MAFMEWTDACSVKILLIDEQHQRLFALANDLHEARRSGQGREVVGKVLDELVAYALSHFKAEERLMSQHGYPGLSAHVKEHEAFVSEVAKFHQEFKDGNTFITAGVMSFMQDWLMTHIQGTDKLYGPFLNAKGIR